MTTPAPALPVLKDLANDSGLEPKVLQLLLDHGVTNTGAFFHTFKNGGGQEVASSDYSWGRVKLSTGTFVKLDDVQFPGRNVGLRSHGRRGPGRTCSSGGCHCCHHHNSSECGGQQPPQSRLRCRRRCQTTTGPTSSRSTSPRPSGASQDSFPHTLLSGADEVLARLVHERVTRSFSPLRWGRSSRTDSLQSPGQINPFRIKEGPRLSTRADRGRPVRPRSEASARTPEVADVLGLFGVGEAWPPVRAVGTRDPSRPLGRVVRQPRS